jgi:hypothetical protein
MSMFWNIRRDIRLVLTATQKEAQHQRRVPPSPRAAGAVPACPCVFQ